MPIETGNGIAYIMEDLILMQNQLNNLHYKAT